MQPIYLKSTFWRRLPGFHPAILRTAVRTALHSRRTFEQFSNHSEIFNGSQFNASGGTTAHPFWFEAFKHERQTVKSILEIGAFEGQTTVFIAWLFPHARITCIDPWKNYNEVSAGMDAVGEAFRSNVSPFADRVRPITGYSSDELPKLIDARENFDIVFIDGSHYYADVLLDSLLAWKLLKTNGVLIWDDYLWQRREYGNKVPKLAIDQFLSGLNGSYEPIWAFKQVAIRKSR